MTTKQKAAKQKTTENTDAVAVEDRGMQTEVATSDVKEQSYAEAKLDGKVLWFDNAKGYGFIQRDDGGGDVFVHFSGIDKPGYRTLQEGERVEFVLTESSTRLGRMQAAQVRARS